MGFEDPKNRYKVPQVSAFSWYLAHIGPRESEAKLPSAQDAPRLKLVAYSTSAHKPPRFWQIAESKCGGKPNGEHGAQVPRD